MKFRPLGRTEIRVSAICLGTMTFGEQNSPAEAFDIMDRAIDSGINFLDTAEMYAVPTREETFGASERIVGDWLKARGARRRVIVGTKVTGPADWLPWIRGGNTRLDRNNIEAALHGSLKRLQTDYIDLYQLHWPDRDTNYFGKLGYEAHDEDRSIPLLETLRVLAEQVQAGKVRHIGVSNESPWGLMHAVRLTEREGLPRIVSVQNPYSLLNRVFEIGLAEVAHHEAIGLLAYSPLGFGVLSGKYLANRWPPGARLTRFKQFARYLKPAGITATERYAKVAAEHGLSFVQMALAYVTSRPFLTSTVIGATTLGQLTENTGSVDLELPDEVLAAIEAVHDERPNPCP